MQWWVAGGISVLSVAQPDAERSTPGRVDHRRFAER
jgi:hypothetical protein